jgi:DNA ligase D-like protein (predicted 3'-phosphoesterase)
MEYQVVIDTNAPVQLLATIFGPVDMWSNEAYIPQRTFASLNHLKALVGTAQGRAGHHGYKFHSTLMPAGAKPPEKRQEYRITSPVLLDQSFVSQYENWELRSPYQKFYAKELSHPHTVIIPPNEYYSKGLTERQLTSYNSAVADLIIAEYQKYDLDGMVRIKVNDKLVVKRHARTEIVGMKIGDKDAFEAMNSGRTVEYHFALGPSTKLLWVDLDPNAEFPWADTKRLAREIADYMEGDHTALDNVSVIATQIRFSGRDGFHVYAILSSEISTDDARRTVQTMVDKFIEQQKDERLTAKATKDPKQIRLDYSTLKETGGLRSNYSLAYPTGLACIPLTRKELEEFEKEDAQVYDVMDRLGRALIAHQASWYERQLIDRWIAHHFGHKIKAAEEEIEEGAVRTGYEPTYGERGLMKRRFKEGAKLTPEEHGRIVDIYSTMGWKAFAEYVNKQVYGYAYEALDRQDLWGALEGSAILGKVPLTFKANSLEQYRQKRDFAETPEPKDDEAKPADQDMYVVQLHRAKKAGLHYDLRLTDQGVMKSWAIPNLSELLAGETSKVKAIQTEDHPLSYATFEGIIPEGQYGGGTVEIFDSGVFETTKSTDKTWEFQVRDGKMKGTWVLVKVGKDWILQRGKGWTP